MKLLVDELPRTLTKLLKVNDMAKDRICLKSRAKKDDNFGCCQFFIKYRKTFASCVGCDCLLVRRTPSGCFFCLSCLNSTRFCTQKLLIPLEISRNIRIKDSRNRLIKIIIIHIQFASTTSSVPLFINPFDFPSHFVQRLIV